MEAAKNLKCGFQGPFWTVFECVKIVNGRILVLEANREPNYATTNAQKGQFVVTQCNAQTNFLFDLYKVFQW